MTIFIDELIDIRQGVSRLRNKVIGRVFRELNLIEQWGSGIRRIFQESKEMGLPEPKIEELGLRYRFSIYLAEPMVVLRPELSTEKVTEQVAGQVTGQVAGQVTGQVTDEIARLLHVIKDEMTRLEIQQSMNLKGRDNFQTRYLKPALDAELVEMTIPNKSNSRLQKYRLTEKGRKIVDSGK